MSELGGRLAEFREHAPELIGKTVQVIADNPVPFVLCLAAAITATAAARNIVKPKTALEVIALEVLLQAAVPYAARYAVESGLLKLRVRDENGVLVPFERKLRAVK